MYSVKLIHTRPTYRKGDLEGEDAVIDAKSFKTRKEAVAYIEGNLKYKSNVFGEYHKGDYTSYRGYTTGKKWVHENTGDTWVEAYTYALKKG